MSRIITIGREFGSGGREVGRRLAEKLNIAYYDYEIVLELAKRTHFTEEYIRQIEESPSIPLLPITIGRTFSPQLYPMVEQNHSVYIEQSNIIREMAGKSDCVIVGRCADSILRSKLPLRLFVYASMDFKIARCREKGGNSECLTDRELKQQILSIDKRRSKYYQLHTDQTWGNKSNYDLCINTTFVNIKDIVCSIAMSV